MFQVSRDQSSRHMVRISQPRVFEIRIFIRGWMCRRIVFVFMLLIAVGPRCVLIYWWGGGKRGPSLVCRGPGWFLPQVNFNPRLNPETIAPSVLPLTSTAIDLDTQGTLAPSLIPRLQRSRLNHAKTTEHIEGRHDPISRRVWADLPLPYYDFLFPKMNCGGRNSQRYRRKERWPL